MKFFIAIIFTCTIGIGNSQFNHAAALQKYWNYRYALLGDDIDLSFPAWEPGFLEVGRDPGHSLPMRNRYRTRSDGSLARNQPYDYSNIDNLLTMTKTTVSDVNYRYGWCRWVDCPTDMGIYLAILATEFELMSKNVYVPFNLPPNTFGNPQRGANYRDQMDRLMNEISCAIYAVDRLDANSDDYYDIPGENGNGFFVRDDVPYTFAQDGKFGKHKK